MAKNAELPDACGCKVRELFDTKTLTKKDLPVRKVNLRRENSEG